MSLPTFKIWILFEINLEPKMCTIWFASSSGADDNQPVEVHSETSHMETGLFLVINRAPKCICETPYCGSLAGAAYLNPLPSSDSAML